MEDGAQMRSGGMRPRLSGAMRVLDFAGMRGMIVAFSAVLLCGVGVRAQAGQPVDPKLAADIRQLLLIEGVVQSFPQIREQAIAAGIEGLRKQGTVSEEGLAEFERRFRVRMDPEPYLDTLIRIYAKFFNDEEIRQIIAFQVSPVGKKLRIQLDALQQEIVLQCQQLGAATGFDIGAQLQKEHPEYFRNARQDLP